MITRGSILQRDVTGGFRGEIAPVPLVVDVDGTLLRSDLMWEGLARLIVREPRRWPGLLGALLRGRAAVKAYAADCAAVDVASVPATPEVLALLDEARAQGRPVVLATACHASYAGPLRERFGPDEILVANATGAAVGRAKRDDLCRRFESFDYVGNSARDISVWSAARHAYGANLRAPLRRRLGRGGGTVHMLTSSAGASGAVLRALRPHQWPKNLLLLLPALAAHLQPWGPVLPRLAAAFAAFCAAASAIYLLNDLADLSDDRRHPRKRARPLASGELSIPAALATVVALLALSAVLAAALPPGFGAALAVYTSLAVAYSAVLKRLLLVDVIVLAVLYTVRVLAGAAAAGVALSRWFIALSVFLFFALALVKRVTELEKRDTLREGALPGRAYRDVDKFALAAMGASATSASCLVYTLYITSPEVGVRYARPDLLWPGLPLLLYWQARLWVFALRGDLHDDPIAFSLRDRVSLLAAGLFLVMVGVAA